MFILTGLAFNLKTNAKVLQEVGNQKYDYLVVGSGLSGSVFAHEAAKKGKKVETLASVMTLSFVGYFDNPEAASAEKRNPGS